MKTVTVVIPTYNEEANIEKAYERIRELFEEKIRNYEFNILFIDNASHDRSRELIRDLCGKDNRVQAIFNNTNFGFSRSSFYGLSQAEGDCAVLMYADMQDPPEVIEDFLKKWEEGYKIVVGIKSKSKENPLMYAVRGVYYRMLDKFSDIEHIRQFDGFGLYDAEFIEELRRLEDPLPYLRGLVAELGPERAVVEYTQEVRKEGKSSFNFMRYYDVAMLGITSSTKAIMRMATFLGMILSALCTLVAIVTLIIKLFNWDYYSVGTAAVIIGIFFVGGIQIFFLGFLGEYIVNINQRTMKHPVVVEKERINLKRVVKSSANRA
ncbi:MAG: glycosyltransferase family 2 protein [Lachnospiraceae bacterium]|nr:glycosyltransferase family 2 protein [Lachnospiraceae bacterium]